MQLTTSASSSQCVPVLRVPAAHLLHRHQGSGDDMPPAIMGAIAWMSPVGTIAHDGAFAHHGSRCESLLVDTRLRLRILRCVTPGRALIALVGVVHAFHHEDHGQRAQQEQQGRSEAQYECSELR